MKQELIALVSSAFILVTSCRTSDGRDGEIYTLNSNPQNRSAQPAKDIIGKTFKTDAVSCTPLGSPQAIQCQDILQILSDSKLKFSSGIDDTPQVYEFNFNGSVLTIPSLPFGGQGGHATFDLVTLSEGRALVMRGVDDPRVSFYWESKAPGNEGAKPREKINDCTAKELQSKIFQSQKGEWLKFLADSKVTYKENSPGGIETYGFVVRRQGISQNCFLDLWRADQKVYSMQIDMKTGVGIIHGDQIFTLQSNVGGTTAKISDCTSKGLRNRTFSASNGEWLQFTSLNTMTYKVNSPGQIETFKYLTKGSVAKKCRIELKKGYSVIHNLQLDMVTGRDIYIGTQRFILD